jgi:hypothetical protein
MITGIWHGKINKQKVEVKIILDADSLTGTSYYYESAAKYRRYSIKGYFDKNTNSAVWWDDQLLDEKSGKINLSVPGRIPMLSRADFNCPGGGQMMLDGDAAKKENETNVAGEVHLIKTENRVFEDEWDYIIDNFLVGTNDPELIESTGALAVQNIKIQDEQEIVPDNETVTGVSSVPVEKPAQNKEEKTTVPEKINPPVTSIAAAGMPSIIEKYTARTKTFYKDIPVSGDSIELRFYDNAEIDGDSISLFLNDKLIFEHIRLTGNAYVIKLSVQDLNETNDLTMVAENLGSIPPNTSYMVAIVDNKRYDAYLTSTEGSSALIRFTKKSR